MSRPWFRLYSEFVSDPKVQLLAFDDQRHFIAVLCLKCNEVLDSKATSPGLRERMIARALGLDPAVATEVKRRLCEVGLIGDDWQPKRWSARQFESDISSIRTAAYRQRIKNESRSDVSVTSQERTRSDTDQIQIQNRTDKSREPRATRSTATRLSENWELSPESRRFCEAENLDPEQTLAKFRDYWLSASGAKARKMDWAATWRNWCRSEGDRGGRSSSPKPVQPVITWRPPDDGKGPTA